MGYIVGLLSGTGFVLYNRAIAQQISVNAAIVIGHLCRLSEVYENGFYYRQEKIAEDLGLSVYEVRGAIKKLMEAEMVEMVLEGVPARNKYTIREDNLEAFIKDSYGPSCEEFSQLAVKKFDNITNRDTSNNISTRDIRRKEKESSKRVYGTYKHVRLTDDEFGKLHARFPDADTRITKLDNYMESHGKSYKNHYQTILNWADMEQERLKAQTPQRVGNPVDYDV